jgi:hypothetical protein
MPDLLSSGAAWLESQRHQHLAKEVVYRRGPLQVTLRATVGRTEFELADEQGILQRVESRDFLVRADDLTFGIPQAGDVIVEGGLAFEVNSPGGTPAWRYSDPNRATLRIHTKAAGRAT